MTDALAQAVRENRAGHGENWLVHIAAKNRTTGAVEAVGFWDGPGQRDFDYVDQFTGEAVLGATFYSGAILSRPRVQFGNDLNTRALTMDFNIGSVLVYQAVRMYDAERAPIQIWRMTSQQGQQVGALERYFKGVIDAAPIPRPEVGGSAVTTISAVSTSYSLAIARPQTYSEGTQKKRASGDTFFQYMTEGEWPVSWGGE